jgi:hypothetical protein
MSVITTIMEGINRKTVVQAKLGKRCSLPVSKVPERKGLEEWLK